MGRGSQPFLTGIGMNEVGARGNEPAVEPALLSLRKGTVIVVGR